MKLLALIIGLTVITNLSLFGQEFISENKQWNVKLSGFGNSTEIFQIEGDSLLNSTLYSKIWVSYDSLSSFVFQGLLREESNIVYYVPPNMSEGILYDFNLEIGETTMVNNIFCGDIEIPISVINIDTIEYFGVSRKRWHIGSNGGSNEIWVEGIGSLNGPLYTKYWYCIVCPVWELLCFHYNDTLGYIMPGETDCYNTSVGVNENHREPDVLIKPNPVKKGNLINIEATSKLNSISIYNSAGIRIKNMSPINEHIIRIETNTLESGMYFITVSTGGKSQTQKLLIK